MRIRDDHDGAWKEIIGDFLGALLAMLLPKLHAAIDWAAPVEFLDTELRAAVRGPRGGRLHCDRLAQVHRRDGKGELLLLHMEVQGRRERGFAGRMFDYWSRIRARMGHAPVSVALLAGRGAWRTCGGTYRWRDHGCALRFDYVAVDLSDMDLGPWLARGNVVAHLIKAHRLAMETRGRPTPRMEGKVGVTRALLGMGLKGRQLNRAMRAVNWLLALPEAKELEFQERLGKLEGGKIGRAHV